MEVWASGVTYRRSREARKEESSVASVYDLVYDAERPELIFKAPAWRDVTDGEPIGIRADSDLNVPEPALALVLNSRGEIVGCTICNDMSSRNIEGENPLYLPQAKVYAGSCALSAGIRLAGDIADPYAPAVEATPDLDLSALASDVVTITIDEVGTLSNTVVMGNDAFAPLASEAAGDRPRTPR
jgi:2-dehydro-3-deoxy-D-arabinonate dehydratase